MEGRRAWVDPVGLLQRDLAQVFGGGLRALLVYDPHGTGALSSTEGGRAGAAPDAPPPSDAQAAHAGLVHTFVVVDDLGYGHLRELAALAGTWAGRGLAVPLVVSRDELARSLDAFPLEYAAIIGHRHLVLGDDPFASLAVGPADLRRACEVQARGHLLHLREGLIETCGRLTASAALIAASAPGFRALLANLARLDGAPDPRDADLVRHAEARIGLSGRLVREVIGLADPGDLAASDVERLLPEYLAAVERLVRFVDEWAR